MCKGCVSMTLDERCTQIITALFNSKKCVSVERLTNQLGISKRTVYYDVQKINTWLEENKLEKVKKKHSKGYYLEKEAKEIIPKLIGEVNKFQYFYSMEERSCLIAVELLTSQMPVFIEKLMELTQVSRATVSNDLKEIKRTFLQHQLEVSFHRNSGYKITGKEELKRQLLVNYLAELMTTKKEWNNLIDQIKLPFYENDFGPKGFYVQLNSMKPLITECEEELSIELTDEAVHLLALKLIVIIQRLMHGNRITIDNDEQEALTSTTEYQASVNISRKLEMLYSIYIPDSEICFITMNLLGSKVNYSELEDSQNQEMKKLRVTVKSIVQDFQHYACILFQDSFQLEESLFKHLKPAYYRVKYNVSLKDENTENLQREFPEIFELTKKSIRQLEQLLGAQVKDSEVAYISMHLGGWLQREGKRPVQRKKAMIVCENGLGTSNILWGQLEKIVAAVDIIGSISQRQYESNPYDVDFVFATAPIKSEKHPVLIVNPILTDRDKEAVLSFVNNHNDYSIDEKTVTPTLHTIMNIVRKHTSIFDEKELIQDLSLLFSLEQGTNKVREEKPVLNELLTKETIQLKTKVANWQEAIRFASEPLIANGSITEDYVEAMITNVDELGPYVVIAPEIALPHARPEYGVEKIGMSLLLLGESTYFSKEERHRARLIVVLAAVDNEKHLKALAQLSTMLSDEEVLQDVMGAESVEDIITCIDHHSTI